MNSNNKTGRFGIYFYKEKSELGYKQLARRMLSSISDGRDYLIWTRTSCVADDIGCMFDNSTERIKSSIRIVLSNYETAEIGEFTILPSDEISHPKIVNYSVLGDNDYPIYIAQLGDIYLEDAGWVAPNLETAWFRIPVDKYELSEINKLIDETD